MLLIHSIIIIHYIGYFYHPQTNHQPTHRWIAATQPPPSFSKALQILSSLRPRLFRRGRRGGFRNARVFDDVVNLLLHLVPGRRWPRWP